VLQSLCRWHRFARQGKRQGCTGWILVFGCLLLGSLIGASLIQGALLPPNAAETTEKPMLSNSDPTLDRAFAIALSDVEGNVHPYRAGWLETTKPVLMAGAGYDTPWTRDAAINVWNGAGLLWPEVAKNTLLSVLERKDGKALIGGQYWDAILWTTGAWNSYLYTGDRDFLGLALEATENTLAQSGNSRSSTRPTDCFVARLSTAMGSRLIPIAMLRTPGAAAQSWTGPVTIENAQRKLAMGCRCLRYRPTAHTYMVMNCCPGWPRRWAGLLILPGRRRIAACGENITRSWGDR
jgi:hypothetical protein